MSEGVNGWLRRAAAEYEAGKRIKHRAYWSFAWLSIKIKYNNELSVLYRIMVSFSKDMCFKWSVAKATFKQCPPANFAL
jgi:hypothetical protein